MTSPHSPADRRLAWAFFALAFGLFLWAEKSTGFTRDESVYFAAAESYAGWMKTVLENPAKALTDTAITQAYDFNHEHPALMKNLYGLSFWVFHETLHWMRPATAFRLPALAFSALIPFILFLWACALYGRTAGTFAALSFLLVPRQFFNAQLACFDMPIAAMWLGVTYLYWRALSEKRFWLWCGLSFGLALATKHNALFLPFVLTPFSLWKGWKASVGAPEARKLFLALVGLFVAVLGLYGFLVLIQGPQGFLKSFELISPHVALFLLLAAGALRILFLLHKTQLEVFRAVAPLVAMAVLGPILFYLHWPYLWHHPVERAAWYLAFHAQHHHYTWFYLGKLLREPPFPLEYVWLKTALTVPLSIFAPMMLGYLAVLGRGLYALGTRGRSLSALPSWTEWLLWAHATASIAIISHPDVPHFGGVKHWLPSMPFLSILAGASVTRVATFLQQARPRKWVPQVLVVCILAPSAWALSRIHPYGTAYYSELAGGVPGAASLGMQRQFWSSHVTAVLDWLNQHAPLGARVYLHEVNFYSFRDYQRNGMLRKDLKPAGGPQDADMAAYQYHQEFREIEFNIWQAFGTTQPVTGLYVDGTPQVIVYQRR